jgi:hypothetical protein
MPKTRTKGRSCTGKSGVYPSRQAAEDALWAYIRRTGAYAGGMHAYACDFGAHWHYGHKGRKR